MSPAATLLSDEARALLTRLDRLKPYSLLMPTVPAAAVSPAALTAIERHMRNARRHLRRVVGSFLAWLTSREAARVAPAEMQRRFTLIRLRFNTVLSQFDVFADVLNQRAEHETGTWVSGLDVVATDALDVAGIPDPPSVVCYLDRGHGAAIRRVRTRLPGGDPSPVAIIRVPRERMVGSGIAASLVHEVGHQAAALLDLVASVRPVLRGMQRKGGDERQAWQLWDRWISEILADLWSVGRVGLAAPLGLMGVLSLPRAFVFRVDVADPHPAPWIRVKLSCALGNVLYPARHWSALSRLWESYYPRLVDSAVAGVLAMLERTMPALVTLLVHHRPPRLQGRSLQEALAMSDRQPVRLNALLADWTRTPARMRRAAPTLVFAALGYARAEGRVTPEVDGTNVANLLNGWALRGRSPLPARPQLRSHDCQCRGGANV